MDTLWKRKKKYKQKKERNIHDTIIFTEVLVDLLEERRNEENEKNILYIFTMFLGTISE